MNRAVVLVFVAGGLFGCTVFTQINAIEEKPKQVKKTQWDGYRDWYHLTRGRAITGDPTGHLGNKEVEKGYREVFFNKTGEKVAKGKAPYVYPEGTVIVREVYSDKKAWEAKKEPVLTISIKLAKGAAPDSKDWEYVLVVPGQKEQRGRGKSETGQFCTKCHLNAKESNDFHFTNASFFEKRKN
jgi:hypothetical protein